MRGRVRGKRPGSGKRANGEGSVFWSNGHGRYVAQVTIGQDARGKPVCRRIYGKRGDRSRIARLAVEERAARYLDRRGSADGTVSVKHFADEWIEHAPIRTNTRTLYRWLSRTQFGALGSRNVIDLEPQEIRRHLEALEVGAPTKQRFRSLLHKVLQEAVYMDMITRNPVANVKPPRVEHHEARILTPLEVRYLLRAAQGDRLEALVVVALTSTMGPAELFALRRRDVYLNDGYLLVTGDMVEPPGCQPRIEATKTKRRRRRIDLPPIAVEALRERMKLALAEGAGELVFTSPEGEAIRNGNLRRRWWKPLVEKAADLAEADAGAAGDPNYRFPRGLVMYELRHTANALMGLAGVPLEVARERMGHSSIKLTADTYGHVYASLQHDAAARLDRLFGRITGDGDGSDGGALVHAFVHDAEAG